MEHYIEVIGESTLVETVQAYVADINLSIRTVQAKTALDEIRALGDRCIDALVASGLKRSELQEGRAGAWRPWFSGKKTGQEAFQKIVVACPEITRLMQALSALEPLFENDRYSFALHLHPPTFGASAETKHQAREAAIQDAYSHARLLAAETQLNLIEVAQIEELSRSTGTGAADDEPWGMAAVATAASDINNLSYFDLDQAARQIKLRYRVRFVVQAV